MQQPLFFLCFYIVILLINPICSKQHYDISHCISEAKNSGSNYLCNVENLSCDTFIVYRAQENYHSLTSISSLFNTSVSHLVLYNNISQADQKNLRTGQEIIVPVTCSCPDRFSEAVFWYNASESESLSVIACEVFEGLVKAQSLMERNSNFGGSYLDSYYLVDVRVKCSCPDATDARNGTHYLVTYPVMGADNIYSISRKFGVSERAILDANMLDRAATIFPLTTLLIPTKDAPLLNLDVFSSPKDQESGKSMNNKKSINVMVILGVVIGGMVLLVLAFIGIFILGGKKIYCLRFKTFSNKRLHVSNLSPDLLDGMSTIRNSTPCTFTLEELRNATKDFSEACVIGSKFYKGEILDSYVAIEEFESAYAANCVVSILTTINHLNIVKLEGCCYGSKLYIVYEFVKNCSLRNCLSNSKIGRHLSWKKRVQIAIDIAVGLHYIHYCTRPNYVHKYINSKSILITGDWRAKISGFRCAESISLGEEKEETNAEGEAVIGQNGYLAPEYLNSGLISTKIDVYAFGVVLLELLSAKEANANKILLKDFLDFPVLRDSSKLMETLKTFMDPTLENDYPLEGATCFLFLAIGCVGEDPIQRPSMNDVIITLSSIK